MTKAEIRKRLRENADFLHEQFGVSRIGVFGSYARDRAQAKSDIDLLVEFARPIGWEIVDLQLFLEDLLEKEVDLVTKNALKPQLKTAILDQVVYV